MKTCNSFFKFSLVIVLLVLSVGCSTKKTMVLEAPIEIPKWFSTPPSDKDYLYGVATASSKDLQLALDKAATDARAEIARQTDIRIQGLQKKFDEETGVGSDAQLLKMYTQATKTVVSTSLNGSKIKDQSFQKIGDIYRTFVLAEYPIGAANQEFINQLKAREELYTRFKATQTIKELEEEVKRYEDWKKDQGK